MPIFDLAVFGITAVWIGFICICYVKSKQYDEYFSNVANESIYFLRDFYPIGFAALKILHVNLKKERGQKLLNDLKYLYGEKDAEFYLEVVYSRVCSFVLFACPCVVFLYELSGEAAFILLGAVIIVILVVNIFTDPHQSLKKRSREMTIEFADVTSKLAILTNAGMLLREAWRDVALEGEGVLYDEMQNTVLDMENGASDADAIKGFGNRSNSMDIKKFSASVVQNLEKGSGDLPELLMEQSRILWEVKKQEIKRQSSKAAELLIWPTLLIFIGILIMIIIPVFESISF